MTVINSNRVVRGPVTAVPLVAGKGVVITADTVNNRFVAEVDETVLWEETSATTFSAASSGVTLSENPFNFEYIRVYWVPWQYSTASDSQEAIVTARVAGNRTHIGGVSEWNANGTMFLFAFDGHVDSTKFYTTHLKYWQIGDATINTGMTGTYLTRVVGVNRIASN